jgi:hypothetical protein
LGEEGEQRAPARSPERMRLTVVGDLEGPQDSEVHALASALKLARSLSRTAPFTLGKRLFAGVLRELFRIV